MASLADFRDPGKFITLDRIRRNHEETDEQRDRRLSARLKNRHCLLAEIEAHAYDGRVRLGVRDRDGARFELKLPRGIMPDNPGGFDIGHTVAAMNPDWYPKARQRDGCVVVEDEVVVYGGDQFKASLSPHRSRGRWLDPGVFPHCLDAILRANAGVVAYTPPPGIPKACHACGNGENVNMECVPCRFVAYCDKNCQRESWRHMGHMMACQVLRDPDIRRLMELDYDSEKSFRFTAPMADNA